MPSSIAILCTRILKKDNDTEWAEQMIGAEANKGIRTLAPFVGSYWFEVQTD